MSAKTGQTTPLGPLFAPRPPRSCRLTTEPGTERRWHWVVPVTRVLLDGQPVGHVRDRRVCAEVCGIDAPQGPAFRWSAGGRVPWGAGDCVTLDEALAALDAHLLRTIGGQR